MKRKKKSLRSDATDTHISDVSGDGHEGDYAAANLIVSRRSPSPSIREALEEQVREVEAEKMALQVQKAKLEVTSDKQISYRMSINVAHSLVWQNMCKLTNIIEMHSGLVMLSIFAN
jgi:exonuclease VII large subunit